MNTATATSRKATMNTRTVRNHADAVAYFEAKRTALLAQAAEAVDVAAFYNSMDESEMADQYIVEARSAMDQVARIDRLQGALMNTDLVAKTTAALTLHAGKWAKHVPAGTEVWVREEAIESGRAAVYVRVVGHERISGAVYRNATEA